MSITHAAGGYRQLKSQKKENPLVSTADFPLISHNPGKVHHGIRHW